MGLVYAAWKIIRVGAVVVGITLATSTFLVSAESWVLADALLGIATTWFVWMVATSWYPESDSKRPLILAGLIGGLCILLKGEGLFITAGVAFAFLINMLLSFRRVPIRKSFTAGLAIAAGLVALVLPWMIRNQVQYGRPSISSLGGQAMFYRVFDSALLRPVEPGPGEYVLAAEQRLADGQGVTNEGFREALGPRIEEYEELLLDAVKEEASFSRTWQTYIYMRTSGLSMHETLGAMQQAATASASAAKSQFKTAVERSLGDGLTLMREPATAEVQSALGLSERMTNPVDRLPPVLFQPWVLLVAGAGALFGRGKSATVALFAGWAFIAERLGVAIFHGGDPRYVAHVIGASALLVTFGWIGLLDRLWAIGASLRNRFSKSLTPERSWS